MKNIRYLFLLVALMAINVSVMSQPLSGTYYIPSGGTPTYATIEAAITALNANGVSGSVIFEIAAGHTETFTSVTAGNITNTTSSSANPILFRKSGSGANPLVTAAVIGTATAYDGIIRLGGCDYVTFDAINLQENPANVTAAKYTDWGYAILVGSATDASQNIVIKNCAVSLSKLNTTAYGIYSYPRTVGGVATTPTSTAGVVMNCNVDNCTISNVYNGIYWYGGSSTATYYGINNRFGFTTGNNISNYGGSGTTTYAIYTIYQDNLKIANNIINGASGNTTTTYGIFTSTATNANVDIYGNTVTIQPGTGGAHSSSVYAINNAAGGTGTNNTINMYNNIVENCTYNTTSTGVMYGIYQSATAMTVNMYGNIVRNNKKTGSTGAMYLLYSSGLAANGIENVYNNEVYGNRNSATGAVYCVYSNTVATAAKLMYGNTVYSDTSYGGSIYGLTTTASATASIYKNKIYHLGATLAAGIVYGIYITSGGTNHFYNNFVSDLQTPAATGLNAVIGINLSAGTTANAYYNTVYLNASSSGATFGTSAIYISTTPNVELRNNIFDNVSSHNGNGGYTVAYRRTGTSLTTFTATSNNNNYYASSALGYGNYLYYDGSAGLTGKDSTLSAYKARVTPRETNSFSEASPFINVATTPYDLHLLTTTPTQCESGGIRITAPPVDITTDYDGNLRQGETGYSGTGTAPDVGADEFNGIPTDLTPPTINYALLPNVCSAGTFIVTATITDGSGIPTSGIGLPQLYYKVNSGSYLNVQGISIGSNQYTFSFTPTISTGDIISYYIVAQDNASTPNMAANPSAGAAGFLSNPPSCSTPPATPNSFTFLPSLAGPYSIPGGFTTIEAAITALNNSCIGAGGVTFNVAGGHTETFSGPLAGLITVSGSASNPIIFQKSGGGANPLITASGAGTVAPTTTVSSHGDGVIILNGGDYITFDGIDIQENAAASTGTLKSEYGYYLKKASGTDACKDVTIRNCTITLDKTVIYTFGIFVSNISGTTSVTVTSTGGRSENIKIYNNAISNSYGGINLAGYSSASPYDFYDQNIEVGKDGANTITNFGGAATGVMGIYTAYQNNLKIANNTLSGGTVAGAVFYGIYTSTATNSNLEISGNTLTLTGGATTSNLMAIYNTMGGTGTNNAVSIFNNTVENCTYSTATTGVFYGINQTASAFNLNLYGNHVSNNSLGSGTVAATGTFYGISTSGANTNTGSLWRIYGNDVNGNSRVQSTLGAGTSYGIYNASSGLTLSIYSNNIYSNSWPSSGSAYGIYLSTSAPDSLNIEANEVHDLSKPNAVTMTTLKSGTLYGIYVSSTRANAKTHIRSNNVYNLTNTWGGQVLPFRCEAGTTGTINIYSNTAYNITGNDQAIFGIYNAAGLTNNIYKNRLFNINAAVGDSASFYGICTGSTTPGSVTSVFNNYVSDLKAPEANVFLSAGLYLFGSTAGTTHQYFNNTVYLNQAPSAGNPATAAVFANTAPNFDMRNNILVNNSTVFGTGATIGYWRSSTTTTTYLSTSNYNCLHAGTPGTNNLIFYDGTNADQTLSAYQTRFPQEGQSFTEQPPFTDIAATPYNLHLLTTVATSCESGGTTISSPAVTTDYDNQSRYPNSGYPDNPSYPATAPDVGADEFGGIPNLLTCTTPAPGNTVTNKNSICLGESITLSLQNPTAGTGVTYQWQSSPDDVVYTDISGANASASTNTPTSSLYYKCKVTCINGPSTAYSSPLQITFANTIASTTPGTRCGTGTVDLAATTGGGTLNWFAALTGGSPIGTGSPFTTPVISTTTTYYVSASNAGNLFYGARLAPAATTSTTPSTYGLVFDAYQGFTLNSVEVYCNGSSGTMTIQLQNSSGTILQTSSVFTVPAGTGTTPYTAALGWSISAGTGYRLLVTTGTASLVRESSLGGFPYALGSIGSVTSGYISGTSTTYYYMYNWNISGPCESARSAVTATVTPAPAVTALATPSMINTGESSTLTASSSNDPNYTYTWAPATTPPTGASVLASPTVTTTYTVNAVDNSAGPNFGCATSATAMVSIIAPASWIGVTSSNWNTTTNWNPATIPVTSSNVSIPNGTPNNPVISTAGNVCRDLVVISGATLTINSGGQLTAAGGTLLQGSECLIIKSGGSFIDNGTISGAGSARVERDLVPSMHHYISPPISNGTIEIFLDDYLRTSDPAATNGWGPWFILPLSQPLEEMRGYDVWRTPSGTMTKLFIGNLNTGNKSIVLNRTATDPWAGWHLVGNAYPSALDLASTGITWNQVEPSAWFWNPGSGNYDVYPSAGPTYGTHSQYAPALQGFFVHIQDSYSGNTQLAFNNTARTHNTEAFLKDCPTDVILIKVTGNINTYSDKAVIQFNNEVTNGYDPGYDASKLEGKPEAPQLWSKAGNSDLTIQSLPWGDKVTTVPLGFKCGFGGTYTFTADKLESFKTGTRIYIEDIKENLTQELTQNPVFTFDYSKGDDSLRFLLHFHKSSIGIADKVSQGLFVYSFEDFIYVKNTDNKPLHGELSVIDLLGRPVFKTNLNGELTAKVRIPVQKGYYVVRVITTQGTCAQKVYLY